MLSALENALVVRLDCLEGGSWPTWGLTTTTADWRTSMPALKNAERVFFQWLRRNYGKDVQYLGFVEWTTGKHSFGRRPHIHHLVKGLPLPTPTLVTRIEGECSAAWKRATGDSWVIECRPLRTPLGALAYLALHHHKEEQAPPPGFRGKRFRPSRGYFNRPVAELRSEARALISNERIVKQLVEQWEVPHDFDATILDELILANIDQAREEAASMAPHLVRVQEDRIVNRATGEVRYDLRRVIGPVGAAIPNAS